MNKLIKSNVQFTLFYIAISLLCVSCISSKQIKYFQNISDSTKLHSLNLPLYTPVIVHVDDVLSITISTTDDKVTTAVNAASNNPSSNASSQGGGDYSPQGYQVDSLGTIEIPMLGKIRVLGFTVPQITALVKERAQKYFIDPVVVVKLRSFKVSILGEVAKPGTIYISSPKASIFDLLSLSGDLTAFAKRNDILLLRHNSDNTLSTIRIDLTNSSIFNSPYYYLQSNDVFYVEPNSSKAISSDATFNRNLTLGTLGLSVLTTILYLFR